MKKKEKKQLIITIFAVLLIIAVVGGGTYAYWSWETSTSQQTLVSVTVRGATLEITGTNVTKSTTEEGLYPTNVTTYGCNPGTNPAVLKGSVTVTAKNYTATDMLVTLKLKGTLSASQGSLTSTNKAYLKWAIVETTSGITITKNTCTNPGWSGTFSSVTTGTNIDTGITWTAHRNDLTTTEAANYPEVAITTDTTNGDTAVTTRTYDVYVWLDSGYNFTNTGTTVNDPMQDLSISLTWSENSTLVQGT